MFFGVIGRWVFFVFFSFESSYFSGVFVVVLESGVGSYIRVGERSVLRGVVVVVFFGR